MIRVRTPTRYYCTLKYGFWQAVVCVSFLKVYNFLKNSFEFQKSEKKNTDFNRCFEKF